MFLPVDGQTYLSEMPSMQDNDDQWIVSIVSYVRHEFTNAPAIRPPIEKDRFIISDLTKRRVTLQNSAN